MFKYKTLPWKTSKPNFVAFFVLIGMVFSFPKFELRSDFLETVACVAGRSIRSRRKKRMAKPRKLVDERSEPRTPSYAGNRGAMLSILCPVMPARNIPRYS